MPGPLHWQNAEPTPEFPPKINTTVTPQDDMILIEFEKPVQKLRMSRNRALDLCFAIFDAAYAIKQQH